MTTRFRNRTEAGQLLATKLKNYSTLDICLVRKLGVPEHKELAMGAIASDGVRVLNYDVVSWLGISSKTNDKVAARELRELQRRDRAYRGDRPPPNVKNSTVILVNNGLATGATMRAAIAVLKQKQPQKIVVDVPVVPQTACDTLKTEGDKVVCLATPELFYSIGFWYENFSQTTDEEVSHLLESTYKCTAVSV